MQSGSFYFAPVTLLATLKFLDSVTLSSIDGMECSPTCMLLIPMFSTLWRYMILKNCLCVALVVPFFFPVVDVFVDVPSLLPGHSLGVRLREALETRIDFPSFLLKFLFIVLGGGRRSWAGAFFCYSRYNIQKSQKSRLFSSYSFLLKLFYVFLLSGLMDLLHFLFHRLFFLGPNFPSFQTERNGKSFLVSTCVVFLPSRAGCPVSVVPSRREICVLLSLFVFSFLRFSGCLSL